MPFIRANVDAPFGAIPYDEPARCSEYRTDVGAAAIYPGDLVGQMADGCVDTITSATASHILGVAAHYLAAAAATKILVYDAPEPPRDRRLVHLGVDRVPAAHPASPPRRGR